VAQSYLLTAVSRDGDLKTCNTSYNNCTLTDMQCSNTYNVSVLASNENCTSVPSTNVTFKTGKSDELFSFKLFEQYLCIVQTFIAVSFFCSAMCAN